MWRTRYEAYGGTAAGTVPNGIGFTGHVNDPDTGLVYMQQRYYDPIAARFLSVDPIVTDAETGKAFGRYDYANNNPYGFTDPDGRAGIEINCYTYSCQDIDPTARRAASPPGSAIGSPGGPLVNDNDIDDAVKKIDETLTSMGPVSAAVTLPFKASRLLTASKIASREARTAAKGAKTPTEAAGELAKELGRNRVSARTTGGKQVDIDLAGKGHFDKATGKVVETPHVHTSELHVGPNGKVSANNTIVREATMTDVRTARKLAERE
jgi:RHS repeat-associated protein